MKTPKIVFVANINRCPFNLSDIAKIRKLHPICAAGKAGKENIPRRLSAHAMRIQKEFSTHFTPLFFSGKRAIFHKKGAPERGADTNQTNIGKIRKK